MLYSSQTINETIKRMAGKVPSSTIAVVVGLSPNAVRKRARRIGISLMCTGENHHLATHSNKSVAEARSLHDLGESPAFISESTGIPYRYVIQICAGEARLNG